MTVIRVEHNKNYTCIINDTIRDKRLSFKARGIHHLLLSYPDGWRINIEHLTSESDKDGKTAIASGLKELEELGYLTREKVHNELGHFCGWESVVREIPIIGKPDNRKTRKSGKPIIGKPDAGKTDNRKTGCILNTINSIQVTKKETQERAREESCEFEILEPEPIHDVSTTPQPEPQHTVLVESDSFGQNVPAGDVVTTLVKINPESSAAKCEARFKAQYLSDDELQRYAEVWNEFRPKECMPAPKLDSRTKDRIRAIAKDYSLIDFSGAVCAIRECKAEGEYYRKEKFTLFRFLGEAHVTKMFATHCQYWETDQNYRERIEGKQESASDLPKYYDSKGNLLTGVWAEVAHLRATKPEFQKDRKRA